MTTFRKLAAVMGCALFPAFLMSRVAVADEPSARALGDHGVWQKHEYTFAYLGFTSTYSCDGLADKIKLLLTAAGARKDSKARPGGCAAGFGRPDKFARAYLTFYTLVPANASKPSDDPGVVGAWRPVAVSDRSPRELDTGDCELVEQFRNDVLPMFTTRNVVSRTSCIPHQNSGSLIDLRFESFSAVRDAKVRDVH
jgi:hypothetical protein